MVCHNHTLFVTVSVSLVFSSLIRIRALIGRTLFDKNHSKIFFDPPPRVMEIKTKINKWDLMKLESFCTAKETINKQKHNLQNGKIGRAHV